MFTPFAPRRVSRTRVALLPAAGLLLTSLLTSLSSCGGGGGGDIGPDLGGRIDTTVFTLPAGQTRAVTSDLVINATQSIDISGTMIVKPGVSVALLSDGDLTISGTVKPEEPTRAAAGRGRDGGNGGDKPVVLAANKGEVSGNVSANQNVYACGTGENATLKIIADIHTLNGADGKDRTDPGDDAPNIDIGTDAAVTAIQALGGKCKAFTTVEIRPLAELLAGDGGDGYQDETGVTTGRNIDYVGTDAGRGGSVYIKAEEIIASGRISAGNGGLGGGANETALTPAQPGTLAGEKGGSVTMKLGRGGDGGDVVLTGHRTGTLSNLTGPGRGGDAGGANAIPGGGGPAGDGGDTDIVVESAGVKGAGPGFPAEDGRAAFVDVEGGNGGDSEDPAMPGGNGGTVAISAKPGRAFAVHRDSAIIGIQGGYGFNGCAVFPQVKGTRGGNGGRVTCVARLIAFAAMAGGNGGDGSTQVGAAGTGGFYGADKVGPDGKPGEICSYTPPAGTKPGFLAVTMDYEKALGAAAPTPFAKLVKGDVVPLCRIRNGHLSGPEPLIEDRGCTGMHLHAKAGTGGIQVRSLVKFTAGKPSEWTISQRLTDDNAKKCGYGMVSVVPDCKLHVKDDGLQ